jgi:hypothetical protein
MKITLPITLCFLLASTVFAAVPAEDDRSETEPKAPQQSTPADRASRPPRPPSLTFTPSEKVGADSAVSFPVDI